MNKFSTFVGDVEISLTLEECKAVSHPGPCDKDVEELFAKPHIQEMLRKITPENAKKELMQYGAWRARELQDYDTNLKRILWLSAGDILDEQEDKLDEERQ